MISKSEVKYIQSLAHKKFREESNTMVAEGVKMVDELLTEFPDRVQKVYATSAWFENNHNLQNGISFIEVQQHELDKISFLKQSNQVLALVDLPRKPLPTPSGVVLVLDQIQDPGNLGTIIRTADWFGVAAIICSAETADAYSPKVVQSTMGSIFRVPLRYTDLVPYLGELRDCPVYAATLGGESMLTIQFSQPCCLVIGNESKGISEAVLEMATARVSIPRKGAAESLNAAVAAAVLLSRMTC